MKKIIWKLIALSILSAFAIFGISACVSAKDYLLLDKYANDPIMKGLQDNDMDLAQIEDGTGSIGEASSCPT